MRVETITSRGNPLVKMLRKASSRGTTTPQGFALAESPRLLAEALSAGIEIRGVFATEAARPKIERLLPPHLNVTLRILDEKLFAECAATVRPQGVLTLVKLPRSSCEVTLGRLAVVLDSVRDAGNAGTIVRSAEAFGASGAVFLKGSASPAHPQNPARRGGFAVPPAVRVRNRTRGVPGGRRRGGREALRGRRARRRCNRRRGLLRSPRRS